MRLRDLRASLVGVLLAGLVASCGTRVPHDDLRAALVADAGSATSAAVSQGEAGDRGGSSAEVAGATPEAGLGSVTGDVTTGGEATTTDRQSAAGNGSDALGGAVQKCERRLSTIRIATVGTNSGIVGQFLAPGTKSVQAWVRAINDRGGLACHPVEYLIGDDGADPARNQALTREFVEDRGVVAFVYTNNAFSGPVSQPYLTARRIPVIGGEGGGQWFYDSPMYFPQASSGALLYEAAIAAGRPMLEGTGARRLASLTCIEAPLCSAAYELVPELAPKHGFELVYRTQGSLVQPDFTSVCQAAQGAGADVFYVGLDGNSVNRLAKSCNAVGYRPFYLLTSLALSDTQAADPLLDGAVAAQITAPWMIKGQPAIDEFRAAMARYASGVPLTSAGMSGWVAAKLFERAASRTDDPATSEGILHGLWSIENDDLGGLTQPLTFHEGQNAESRLCYFITVFDDGRFAAPRGADRTCE